MYFTYVDTAQLIKQAQTDLAFALAQGDGYAEDAAAERIKQLEADLTARCPICHASGDHSLSCPTRWHS